MIMRIAVELRDTVFQRSFFADIATERAPPQPRQLGGCTCELVVKSREPEPTQKSVQFVHMIRVLRTDKEVNVDKISLHGPGVESQLDIGKEQVAFFQSALCFLLTHALVGSRDVIIRNPDRLQRRRRRFDSIQVQLPAIVLGEVVRQHRPRRMDVRLPSTPD